MSGAAPCSACMLRHQMTPNVIATKITFSGHSVADDAKWINTTDGIDRKDPVRGHITHRLLFIFILTSSSCESVLRAPLSASLARA